MQAIPPSAPSPAPVPGAKRPAISALALAATLGALTMVGSFSVDTYLPAFPDIERSLNTSSIAVQQTLSVYMLAFAGMSLWHGALSDSFGRRNVILVTLTIFVIASLGCASAHSIEYLWVFRVLQGLSAGAGAVVGRAMIRDLYEGPEAQKLFAMVTMVFAVAPAIAPIMGGWIVSFLNWRSIFLFLFGFSTLLLLYCWRKLPETLPHAQRAPFNAHSLWQNYASVLGTLRFHLYAGTISLYHAGFFLYIAAAPIFIIQHLHLGPHQFSWLFVPAISGIFIGSMLTNRLASRIKPTRQIRFGFALMAFAGASNLIYHEIFTAALPWSVLPMFFYGIGISLTSPALTLMVLDLFPDLRGIAASCQTFLQLILSAAVAGVIAPLLSASPLTLAAGQFGFVASSALLWWLARAMVHKEARNLA